ncbi:MAG: 40S ribosomal protein S19, partial [Candidatus Aenigmarchaeota archaeon]|nr:40S ribosomal protein S19 [Candidatus Aenigmarchaeota archaeon]
LQKVYSGRKNLGHQPEHRALASGKILRTLLQQLEAAGLVKAEKRKGRVITPKGQQFLDQVAKEIGKAG